MENLLNKVTQGDCLEVMKRIKAGSIDLIITDPPYKIEAGGGAGRMRSGIFHRNKGDRRLFEYLIADQYIPEIKRVLAESGHVYLFTNDKNMYDMLKAANENGLILMNIITLNKGNKVAFGWFMKQTEFVLLFRNSKGKAKQVANMSVPNLLDVSFPKGKNRAHPSEKSIEVVSLLINQSSSENDTILDCFLGSGTTAVAAINTNRKFIGIECEPEYVEIANQRIIDAYKAKAE